MKTYRLELDRSIITDEATYKACLSTSMGGYFTKLDDSSDSIDQLSPKFKNLFEVASTSSTLSSLDSFIRFKEISMEVPTKIPIAFEQEIEKINRVCQSNSAVRNHATLIIEGAQGCLILYTHT